MAKKKSKMTLEKLAAGVNDLKVTVDNLATGVAKWGEKTNTIEVNLDTLAQITAKGFLEMNEKFGDAKKDLKKTEKKLANKIDYTNQELSRLERIQMAEIERNDHQDTQIKQLESKIYK